ncbi:outer membrane protein [Bradyrhizobium sp.]|uniref:outer membrane protein n=1 Tax=Bradyrhizobium sp. TaxID=376 RepID=UPI003C69543A
MRKSLFANIAILAVSMAAPAFAADLPLKTPAVPFAERFNWTSCYAGAHLGGGFERSDITDPVQLVQDSFLGAGTTTGVTTVSQQPSGAVIGGQIGCDYQFTASSVVVGVQGSASGTTMKSSTSVGLPLGNPDTALVKANTDFLPSLTARLGYAVDNFLFYGKGGVALAGSKYDVTGSFTGLPFAFEGLENRYGWTAGGGVEWGFSQHWSTSLEYDYYQFGNANILMSDGINGFSGLVNVKQTVQVVKLGLNFHVTGAGW